VTGGTSAAEGTGAPDPAGQQPRLGHELQAMIGRQLSAIYHEILSEPVPDRFVRLLEELASKDASAP
jgi:Anti-sigma factor NepR